MPSIRLYQRKKKNEQDKMKQHSGGLEGRVPTTVQDSGEEGQGQRLSCSWQEEMESLKGTVKQLTVKMEEQGEVIAGMKSCFRNVALSLLTFCKDNEEDVNGLHGNTANPEFYENEQATGPAALETEQLKNSELISTTQRAATPDKLLDGDDLSSVTIVKCAGNYSSSVKIPKLLSFAPSVSLESSPEADLDFEHNVEVKEETADYDEYDVNFEDYGHDSSYVPDDECDEESEQDIGNEYNNHQLLVSTKSNLEYSSRTKCTPKKAGFKVKKSANSSKKGLPSSCHLCAKVFVDSSTLRRHIKSAHEGVRYKCDYCPGKFTSSQNLKRHEDSVHKNGGLPTQQCGLCGIHLLRSESGLRNHMNTVHRNSGSTSNEKRKRFRKERTPATSRAIVFQCQFCPLSFPERGDLQCHLSEVHGTESLIELPDRKLENDA